MLQRQGERATHLWYVRSGLVLSSSVARSGAELWCAVRGAPHLVGLEAALGQPTLSSALALSSLMVCTVDVLTFRAWLGPIDSPLGALLELSLSELRRKAVDLQRSTGSASVRLARFLLQRFDAGSGPEPLDVPKVVLARTLGMRPETLSRAIAQLRSFGLLATGRRVVLTNPRALRAFAED